MSEATLEQYMLYLKGKELQEGKKKKKPETGLKSEMKEDAFDKAIRRRRYRDSSGPYKALDKIKRVKAVRGK